MRIIVSLVLLLLALFAGGCSLVWSLLLVQDIFFSDINGSIFINPLIISLIVIGYGVAWYAGKAHLKLMKTKDDK